ncbi:hypothetical protein KIN34_05145 [Cellulomonas sp. DKR-3]|uniref:PASTA domain-containing protein n=1 Tax=Cellulomonas fulva TaxID=2835530 RepID=A0ABS5TX00_9CELL|nr:hypothetical protein [Cellulomonas fulva]MBT0993670.1 hypothetical protein [Cellulomonas fulva]
MGDARDRRVARWVTFGTLAVILLGAAAEAEVWPVTAFRLFSTVRTADGVATTLVAVASDGTQVPVPMPTSEVLAPTSHQLARLAHDPEPERRAKVEAWLELAGLDPADYTAVAVHRRPWTMDASTRERVPGADEVVVEVTL